MPVNKQQKKNKAELQKEIKRLELELIKYRKENLELSEFPSSTRIDTDIKSLIHMGAWFLEIPSRKFSYSPNILHLVIQKNKKASKSFEEYLTCVHPEDRQIFSQLIDQIISDKTSFTKSVRHLRSDNNIIQTLIQVQYHQTSKNMALLTGCVLDVTQFQNATSTIEQENSRYRQLFELSPTGIILEDKNGIILDVNPSFCHSLGYTRKELIGQNVHILAHPDVQAQVESNIKKLLSGKVLKHNEKSIRKDGSICYMELSETKVILPNGEEGILCIAEDYTEKKKSQEERVNKEKLQSVLEMAGAVCHELNQPLTTIFISTDLMIDFPSKENLKELVSVIKNEAIRISKITEKLMRITKYETRDYINGKKIFDIDKAADSSSKK